MDKAIVVAPGTAPRVANVEFLAVEGEEIAAPAGTGFERRLLAV